MDDTLDIEHHQHARFQVDGGRVVIYYDPDSKRLIVNSSTEIHLQVQQESASSLSIVAETSTS